MPKRTNIRLKEYDYSLEGMYFITICTKNRKNILGKIVEKYSNDCRGEHRSSNKMILTSTGKIADKYLNLIEEKYPNVSIDEYTIMPNHIHIILSINEKQKITISQIIQQYKGIVTKKVGNPIWQKLFYEHIIRNEKEYCLIKQYIQDNVENWKKDRYY